MIQIDAANSVLSNAVFAQAYRATIPGLADAKHVTVKIHPNRLKELHADTDDLSDIVEVGTFPETRIDGTVKSTTRIIAVPNTIHPASGAELLADPDADPSTVLFQVNGIPEVAIINLQLSAKEYSDKKSADAKADADAKAAAKKASDDAMASQIEAAKEEGRKEALLEQAKAEGKASVAGTGTKVQ